MSNVEKLRPTVKDLESIAADAARTTLKLLRNGAAESAESGESGDSQAATASPAEPMRAQAATAPSVAPIRSQPPGDRSHTDTALQLLRSDDPPSKGTEVTLQITSQRHAAEAVAAAAETLRLTGSWDTLIRSGVHAEPKVFTSAHFGMAGAEDPAVQTFDELPPEEQVIGTLLEDRYHILEIIGRGGMSIVYLGEQLSSGVLVAIKRIKVTSAEDIMRFAREIKSHSRLKHKNIVAYLEFIATSTGDFFLIMERIKGLSLLDIIRSIGRIDDPQNIASVMLQSCNALSYAHKHGVIHRDLKSSNIILVKEEGHNDIVVKILDFGIARMEGEERITFSGRAVGSPLYMSPEQCRSETLTARSDIYSLGVVAYEIITGRPPYCRGSVRDIMRAHCDPYTQPQPIGTYVKNIPGANILNEIIFKCLETDPAKRWQSAEDLKKAFEFWYASVQCGMEIDGLPPEMLTVQDSTEDEPKDYSLSHEERDELRSLKRNKTMQVSFGYGVAHDIVLNHDDSLEQTLRIQQSALDQAKRTIVILIILAMTGLTMIGGGGYFVIDAYKKRAALPAQKLPNKTSNGTASSKAAQQAARAKASRKNDRKARRKRRQAADTP